MWWVFKRKNNSFDSIKTKALVCPRCGFTTFTKEQAKKYVKLKELHQIINTERKIIKIGNSVGVTLPDRFIEFGAEVGKKIRIEALSTKSFKMKLLE